MKDLLLRVFDGRIATQLRADCCWEWLGLRDKDGYGLVNISRKTLRVSQGTVLHKRGLARVNRVIWAMINGYIPSSKLFVCHSCDHPWCVNPDHFWIGTTLDNVRDMMAKGRHRAMVKPESYIGQNQGTANGHACIDDHKAVEIRERYVPWSRTAGSGALSQEFGLSSTQILAIVAGKVWKNAGGPLITPTVAYIRKKDRPKSPRRSTAGANNGHAKLAVADVLEIRRLWAANPANKRRGRPWTMEVLANKFTVSKATISAIVLNKIWTTV